MCPLVSVSYYLELRKGNVNELATQSHNVCLSAGHRHAVGRVLGPGTVGS